MAVRLGFDGDWFATVTGEPLDLVPRLHTDLQLSPCANTVEREAFLLGTFGSQDWLWDVVDILRFDPDDRRLVGAEFCIPEDEASAEDSARLRLPPETRSGGLRADQVKDFRLEACTVLCRTPGDSVLTCLRDLDVLDEPLEARVRIAQDLALLVQHGTVVGWSLTDPVRYVTTPYVDPDPDPPAAATRRLFTECMDLLAEPMAFALSEGEPAALERLRAADQALHDQREDRHRANALRTVISQYVEDYLDAPGRQP
ncbi:MULTISPECIES: hypothetical protein [unclassified Streptomyces]|uniref:hypothetical protein n=1 Tax=unclassified Streptomyces TaxID=2593676 RepID=UPI001F541A91|nr:MULTISPECIES: hypothetical protein [unclassified Streptomyces]